VGPGYRVSANGNEENRIVKKMVISLTALATLGVTAYVGSQLRAQNQPQYSGRVQQTTATVPAPTLRTRIALVNLQQVIKQYRKWNDFEETYKKAYAYYQTEYERKKAAGIDFKNQLDKTTDEPTRDKLTKQLKDLERDVQDLGETAKKQLSKMRDDAAVQIYHEVEQAVEAYARANDIELVLHFNDAVAPADLYNPRNIERKLQTSGCLPMYTTPGMNITDTIALMLNNRLAPAPTSASAPSGQQH
jgi:Skp family chaperone for outer membrane proteins